MNWWIASQVPPLALQLLDDPGQCSFLSSSRSCSRKPLLGEMFLLALTALMESTSVMFSWISRKARTKVDERLRPIAQWTNTLPANTQKKHNFQWMGPELSHTQLHVCIYKHAMTGLLWWIWFELSHFILLAVWIKKHAHHREEHF